MNVMIMAGGTGGHIYPAAAVANQLQARGHTIRWLGSSYGMEGKLVPEMGYEFCALPVTAWHGNRLRKVLAPFNLIRALWHCLFIFRQEQPDVVIGFGGYASAPGGIAALLTRRKLLLHEQNGVPGLTNARLAGHADCVLQAFPETFNGSVEVVGNPVREALCQLPSPEQRGLGTHRNLRVLVLGGSQGAVAINQLVPAAVSQLSQGGVDIWHQTGAGKQHETEAAYRNQHLEATVVEYIDRMDEAYRWADLVIARSGASTVSELAAVGVYSLLIPYPWHKDQQQYRNARWLADNQAATWFDQQELTPDRLAAELLALNRDRKTLQAGAKRAWQIGIRDSAERVARVAEELVSKQEVS